MISSNQLANSFDETLWMDFAIKILEVIDESIAHLPSGIEKVKVYYLKTERTDFQVDIAKFCNDNNIIMSISPKGLTFLVKFTLKKYKLTATSEQLDLTEAMVEGVLKMYDQMVKNKIEII